MEKHIQFENLKGGILGENLGRSQVKWAMSDGIYANPSWYPGVTPQSPFTMFQDMEESRFGTHAWNFRMCLYTKLMVRTSLPTCCKFRHLKIQQSCTYPCCSSNSLPFFKLNCSIGLIECLKIFSCPEIPMQSSCCNGLVGSCNRFQQTTSYIFH